MNTNTRNSRIIRFVIIAILVILIAAMMSGCQYHGFFAGPFSAQPEQTPTIPVEGVDMMCKLLGFCQ